MSKYFELTKPVTIRYPHDMKIIHDYLCDHGKVYCTVKELERMWENFSDTEYSASWLTPDSESLERFAEWLDEYVDF